MNSVFTIGGLLNVSDDVYYTSVFHYVDCSYINTCIGYTKTD